MHHTAGRGRKHWAPGASGSPAGTVHTPPPQPPPPGLGVRWRWRVSCSGWLVAFSTLNGEWMVSTCCPGVLHHP